MSAASDATSSFSAENEASRKVKVYTRTGDKGSTSLFTGERKTKDTPYFQALGDIDELNANVGLCREYCVMNGHQTLAAQLEEIQSRLFDLGSHVATPLKSASPAQLERTKFPAASVDSLEQWIDAMETELPPLRNFILPGGGLTSAHMHIARSVTRRAERSVVPLVLAEEASDIALKYINRLSDFFFVAARFVNLKEQKQELIWHKPRPPRSSEEHS